MANRYWVGGTGNWIDTSHWSNLDGSGGGYSVPGASDVVYITSNSFPSGGVIQTTGLSTITISGIYVFDAPTPGYVDFTSLSSSLNVGYITTLGSSGPFVYLANTINVTSAIITAGGLSVNSGTTINLGNSGDTSLVSTTLTLLNQWMPSDTTINLLGESTLTLRASGASVGTLNINSNPKLIKISPNSYTLNLANLTATGTSGNFIQIGDSTDTITFSKASGTVNCNYIKLKNCHATGGAFWNAGINSVDLGGNTGWVFPGKTSAPFFGAAF